MIEAGIDRYATETVLREIIERYGLMAPSSQASGPPENPARSKPARSALSNHNGPAEQTP
ncbi:hypothetical protein MBLL_03557 [Methylobacterium bullatum]|uniref:Uncharacterized protein n=1 Tax=Methylobacterium bullatum TaxID=570505 RepID=A0A679JY47_9HYPH|nr:hypothetical protein MBLL_03557 [Methylobacterium bullatum]